MSIVYDYWPYAACVISGVAMASAAGRVALRFQDASHRRLVARMAQDHADAIDRMQRLLNEAKNALAASEYRLSGERLQAETAAAKAKTYADGLLADIERWHEVHATQLSEISLLQKRTAYLEAENQRLEARVNAYPLRRPDGQLMRSPTAPVGDPYMRITAE